MPNLSFAANNPTTPARWGDLGDGTFANPVLPGDFSDPDVIRVGTDYFLITSTFQYSPGMAVLHSKDLVNWQYISHCVADLTQIGPELNWDRMNRYNRGIYAGAIRFHDGKFWVYFTTMDEGVFLSTAKDPAGPWEPLTRLTDRHNFDDPCPFWDDDGKAWLLLSTPGKHWVTHIHPMAPDGKSIDLNADRIVDDFQTSEGNKLYKFGDCYYVFHNEVRGGGNRVGVMLRSKNLAGPWEKKEILHSNAPDREKEPNQGGLLDTPDGSWWFITHLGRGSFEGRVCCLLPVAWVDGWPIPGTIDKSGAGNITWTYKKPIDGFPAQPPQSDDEFDSSTLAPQWEWNYQPRAEKWSLTERPGFLRLHAFKPIQRGNLLKVGNTLTQRIMGYTGGEITTKLDVSAMVDGQQAGLAHYSDWWGMVGVVQRGGKRYVYYNGKKRERNAETKKDEDRIISTDGPEVTAPEIWLRSVVNADNTAHASYSFDGKTFQPIGEPYTLKWANYRGDRIALYNFNDDTDAGQVDIDWFHYNYAAPGKPAATPVPALPSTKN